MNVNELDKRLTDIADDFSREVQLQLSHSSCDRETVNMLDEIARQMFYALVDYKKVIVEYEKTK